LPDKDRKSPDSRSCLTSESINRDSECKRREQSTSRPKRRHKGANLKFYQSKLTSDEDSHPRTESVLAKPEDKDKDLITKLVKENQDVRGKKEFLIYDKRAPDKTVPDFEYQINVGGLEETQPRLAQHGNKGIEVTNKWVKEYQNVTAKEGVTAKEDVLLVTSTCNKKVSDETYPESDKQTNEDNVKVDEVRDINEHGHVLKETERDLHSEGVQIGDDVGAGGISDVSVKTSSSVSYFKSTFSSFYKFYIYLLT
jgi:hypothetical protein